MKTLVCVIAYDREPNIRHWFGCWKNLVKDYRLVLLQNLDTFDDPYHIDILTTVCKLKGGEYVYRKNIGYDIGAFQDVCNNRLENFPDYDRLLWLTDDVFPMSTDFIKQFNDAMNKEYYVGEGLTPEKPGVVCMKISNNVKKHIRTSAFMIDRSTAERLTFPADPITTKRQCYEFEHMSRNAFYEQVIKMGLKVVQVAPDETSPLWDSGYKLKLDRQKEHEAIFGPMPEQPKFISKAEHLKNER